MLRNRDVVLYLIGRLVASLGQQMVTVAVGWELYKRTHSTLALGLVGLTQMLPMVLFTLPAGHVADNYVAQADYRADEPGDCRGEPGPDADLGAGRPRLLDLCLPVRGGHGPHLPLAGQLGVSAATGLAPGLFPGGNVEQRQFPTLLGGRAGGRRRVDRPDATTRPRSMRSTPPRR